MEYIFSDLHSLREDFEFAKDLTYAVITHLDDIEKHIKAKVTRWELDRIAMIDRILLRIGICEFLYFPDIPPKVSINESIEIAKLYSTEKSGGFVNGVLDAILVDLRATKTLHKEGRGLLDDSPRIDTRPSSRRKPQNI